MIANNEGNFSSDLAVGGKKITRHSEVLVKSKPIFNNFKMTVNNVNKSRIDFGELGQAAVL